TIQTMKQLPGGVTQIEERLAVFVLEVPAVLGDFEPPTGCGEGARGREQQRTGDAPRRNSDVPLHGSESFRPDDGPSSSSHRRGGLTERSLHRPSLHFGRERLNVPV